MNSEKEEKQMKSPILSFLKLALMARGKFEKNSYT
jgi:hypothetical protein